MVGGFWFRALLNLLTLRARFFPLFAPKLKSSMEKYLESDIQVIKKRESNPAVNQVVQEMIDEL